MATAQKLYSAEEFWQMAAEQPDDWRYELLAGEIVEMAPSSPENSWIALEIGFHLKLYVREHNAGYVMGADGGYTLSPGDVCIPDVSFVARSRFERLPKVIHGPPDLAVEVISPGETARKVHDKTALYLRAGAAMVWNVYPETRTVEVWTAAGQQAMIVRTLGEEDLLDGAELLPGFTLAVKSIFPAAE